MPLLAYKGSMAILPVIIMDYYLNKIKSHYLYRNVLQVGDSMYNKADPLEMYSFRCPKGLMTSVKSVCRQEGINISQFIRASLILGLDLYFDQETGKEINNQEVE